MADLTEAVRLRRDLLKRDLRQLYLLWRGLSARWRLLSAWCLPSARWRLLSARWRGLSARCAFIAVEELGKVPGLVGVDPEDDPGLTPGLLKRVADVAYDRLPGRDRESMQRAPLLPRGLPGAAR